MNKRKVKLCKRNNVLSLICKMSLWYLVLWLCFSFVTVNTDQFRQYDPIELTGSDLYELYGWDIASIVAFRYEEIPTEKWVQIPIQIDEMHEQYWEVVSPWDCRIIGRNIKELMYADASTYSGPDEDPKFDYDDEFTVMARDLGKDRAPEKIVTFPDNVIEVNNFKLKVCFAKLKNQSF